MESGQKNMTVGQRIGLYLEDKGILKSKVAEKAGIAYQRFCEITWGNRRIEAEEYINVCKVLEKDPDFFMEKKEEVCETV